MFTSDTDSRLVSGIKYLFAAITVGAAGWLAFGALPDLLSAARGNKKGAACGTEVCIASRLRLVAIVTLTAGSIVKGVLDIYGTTNRLTVAYPVMGIVLMTASIAAFIRQKRLLAQSPQRKSRSNTYQDACGDAAEHKNRKIEEYAEILDQGGSHQQLAQIVQDSRSHAYTGH